MDAALQAPTSVARASALPLAVVKLGGSIVRSGQLAGWLEVLAGVERPIVIVPGGGALADEVRQCQRQLGFGDSTAHRMALLAMDQLAWAIAGVRSGFAVGVAPEELREILQRGLAAVWAPSALIAARTDLEATWRLTSDSLALWLAGKLGASDCCVVKSATVPRGSLSADALMGDGVVDEAFSAMLAETAIRTTIFGQGDETVLGSYLAGQSPAHASVVA